MFTRFTRSPRPPLGAPAAADPDCLHLSGGLPRLQPQLQALLLPAHLLARPVHLCQRDGCALGWGLGGQEQQRLSTVLAAHARWAHPPPPAARAAAVQAAHDTNATAIAALDVYVAEAFGTRFYDSCADVVYPVMNQPAMKFVGG